MSPTIHTCLCRPQVLMHPTKLVAHGDLLVPQTSISNYEPHSFSLFLHLSAGTCFLHCSTVLHKSTIDWKHYWFIRPTCKTLSPTHDCLGCKNAQYKSLSYRAAYHLPYRYCTAYLSRARRQKTTMQYIWIQQDKRWCGNMTQQPVTVFYYSTTRQSI